MGEISANASAEADVLGTYGKSVKPCREKILLAFHKIRQYRNHRQGYRLNRYPYRSELLDKARNALQGKEVKEAGGRMDRVEKLLYSRRDAAEALSLSVRSIDYLIATRRLTTRRVGGKILIPVGAVRRFAREDHPEFVRAPGESAILPLKKTPVSVPPQERNDVIKRRSEYRNQR